MRYIVIFLSLLAFSCQSTEDHGHAHDENGGHAADEGNRPSVDYTVWTKSTELFVEFPVLVAGQTSRFAAHFTEMDQHQAVKEGNVTVSLIKGGKGIRHTVEAPSSPGIFTPSLQPKAAGIYTLIFELKTPSYSDRIAIEGIQVFESIEEAQNAEGLASEDGNAITFLKEQAWKMEFQTTQVELKTIYETISTSGKWMVDPNAYQSLVAPASGKVDFLENSLLEGAEVKKGELLMTVSSAGLTTNNLNAEIQKAKAEYDKAKSEYERKESLFEDEIVPKSEWEAVKQRYKIAKTNYETLAKSFRSGGKQILAPMDGYVKSLVVENGSFVEQGEKLLSIAEHKGSLLEVQLSPETNVALDHIQNIWYQPSSNKWSSLKETGGRILTKSREVAPSDPLLSVFASVAEEVNMPEGSFTAAQLAVGSGKESMVIPISALLEDYGQFSVMVQLSGESFERRNIVVGNRNGNEVEVLEGLSAEEVVVSKGAYQVKMASMSGQAPAHGHSH
ncbi:hypothetical protein MATR_06610 [Marivirga tractuosa]|uniref:Efflux transporter, RND family, MFP subunit n=1 Tax=Marivirga tractuosa (strain ATCC 23168 / DSM 4126 / NBRC 15989 / NCIMB 1408 / VKM B-1430 / H-43) TaxID=643867 RepID=E4TRI5_MARTH|nr:efflux RND transporter periplasmic adaptor subunit [Marivirga tractuosa]ADR21706.1 efflux transporter, RND family, MFP subunit [Marivirga tractuosa DSM 4126]BDD13836.1 hypothetical protein MATR_06610 [Marivirga tractuosa]